MSDWWSDYPWRLIQTNLREIDMTDISAQKVVQDLKDFNATVLMINAAGIIASYPTQIPYHFQSPYLTGDSLLDILTVCHAAGIRVIARTDFSKVRRPVFEANPEWAYTSVQGETVDYNGDVHVCLNSWYQQVGILNILDELFSSHPFDGVFFNMGGYITHDYSGNYYGPCHCRNCRERFRQIYAEPFPDLSVLETKPGNSSLNGEEPVVRYKYEDFKHRTRREQHETVYRFLADRYPHLCIANHLEFRRGFIRQEANTAVDRPLPLWQYSASENTRWAVGSYPEMVSSSTTVDFIDFPYRHAAVSPHEQSLRLAQSLANGGALDFYLIGRLDNHEDRSGFAPVKQFFHYHANHESDYAGLRSKADIALLKPSGGGFEYRGWYRVLVENHFQFDVLTLESALQRPWRGYRAILIPAIQHLPPSLAQELDTYAAGGGILVACGETSFRSQDGQPLEKPDLDSLGIDRIHTIRRDMRASYFQVPDKDKFPRLVETDLVYLDGRYIYAEYAQGSQKSLKLVPPHNFGPPERCYYTQVTDHPGYTVTPYGRGRSVYLPWMPGSQFYHHGQWNTFAFLSDLLEQTAGLTPLGGNLPPQVEATLFDTRNGSILLQLVNTSGHFGNTYHPPVKLTDLTVTIPWRREPPLVVRSLFNAQIIQTEILEDQLHLHLPPLGLFEAIRLDKN